MTCEELCSLHPKLKSIGDRCASADGPITLDQDKLNKLSGSVFTVTIREPDGPIIKTIVERSLNPSEVAEIEG